MTDIKAIARAALELLRVPFEDRHIGKLPRISCWDCADANRDRRGATCAQHTKQSCKTCGNYLTTKHEHIDYVGHAEVTDRLLDADLEWNWRPMAFDDRGLPAFDETGGLWMYLTVGGVERIGYGSADGKRGPNAVKEAIGDALRNSGMRFGVALDQWAKSNLHDDDPGPQQPPSATGRLRLADDPDHVAPTRVTAIEALFGKHGLNTPVARGAAVLRIVGREVDRPENLTRDEAETLISTLRDTAPGGLAG